MGLRGVIRVLEAALAAAWSALIVQMMNLSGLRERQVVEGAARTRAGAHIQEIPDLRSCRADEDTPPDPHLIHPRRDVTPSLLPPCGGVRGREPRPRLLVRGGLA